MKIAIHKLLHHPLVPSSPFPRVPSSPRLHASLLLAVCILPFALSAQYFTTGTDPASVRWHQVKTEHFKIIYPKNLDSQAIYIANAFEYNRLPGAASLDALPGKWPVVLHNQTVVSNAMTPYAPKRIEIMTTPPQDNADTYAQAWIDQLVIHEYRHAVQYAAVNKGLTRALTYVFGQQAVPLVLGLFVPFWFIEGDAVAIETATSNTGRGRVPSFEMKLRAQFLEKGIFSYDKAYNGSYRDFVPDHYELGYLLVGQARLKYGPGAWSRVMNKTGRLPVMAVPFSNTLYKETGFGKRKLYDNITSGLLQSWSDQDKEASLTLYIPVADSKGKYFTNYTQPTVMPDGRIIARKSSIDDITRIVIIDSAGREVILTHPGYMFDEVLSYAGNLVCWNELHRNARWDLLTFSVIKLLNLETGQTRQLTYKSRYFSPDISPDGKAITAVEADLSNRYFIVILDAENGDIIHRYPTPENYFAGHPTWSPDGNQIAMILTRDEGKSLAVLNPATGKFDIILPFSYAEIYKPAFYKGYILFTGTYTGKEDIFALNKDTRQLYQVTSSRFGASDATVSPDGQRLYYAHYTSDGYELVSAEMKPETWKEHDPAEVHHYALADSLAGQENFIFNSGDVPDSAYQIKPYRKWQHLFNFHSWAPLAIDVDNINVSPGVTLLSQNLLGTSFTTLGYEYDLNEEAGKYFVKYSYQGFYPVFDVNTDYGKRRGVHTDSSGHHIKYSYHELNISGVARIPLNWYVRRWFMGLQPFAGYTYKYLRMDPGSELKFVNDRFHSLEYRLYFYTQSRMAQRDIIPRWGQVLDINYRHTPFDTDTINSIFSAEVSAYFPGLFRHHGLRLYGGYQDRVADDYTYSGLLTLPRGYSGIYADELMSISATYQLPLFYPDWNAGPLIYLKRVKAALFYDQAWTFETDPATYQSLGLDLTFDFHLLRLFVPLEAGLRTVYFPQDNSMGFEFLYSMNLSY